MTRLVSVIIPCFNQENYISKTIQSVKNQSYTNWECIIVDDGSTDNSSLVIQNSILDDNRFRYVYQPNAGVSAARNRGFSLSKGEFINFLDGDDSFLPEKLQNQIDVFDSHPEVTICVCDHQYLNDQTGKISYYKFEALKPYPLEQILFGWHNGVAFPPHAPMYRRSLWDLVEVPFPEDYPHRCEDWVFNVLVALKKQRYHWTDQVLCNYHMVTGNFTAEPKNLAKAAFQASYYLLPKLPEDLRKKFMDSTIDNTLSMYIKSEHQKILNSSTNWRVGNAISRPFFSLLKLIGLKRKDPAKF
jgi:glycosyltransferase involved in cell wall biosynthesis